MNSQEQAAWYDVIGRFKALANQFDAAFNNLTATPEPDDYALAAERSALIDRGSTITDTVTKVRTALADVSAALSGAWNQVTGAWDWISGTIGLQGYNPSTPNLGLPPLIPLAIVAAAITTITMFLSDVAKYRARLSAYQATIAAGGTPDQAATAVATASSASEGGALSDFSSAVGKIGAIGAIGLLALLFWSKRK